MRSPHYGRARLGFALNYFAAKDWSTAVQRLARFRDKPELQNLPGVTDLRRNRLEHDELPAVIERHRDHP